MFVLSALKFVFVMFGVGASGVAPIVSGGDSETTATSAGGEAECFSSREPGNLHFPSAFCGQTTSLFDHQLLREEGKQTEMKMKTLCLQKVARTCGRDLRNGDAGRCQSAPWRDTNAPDMERGANPLAEFLLNPCLSPLRLHIQVQANQGNRNERKKCPNNG